MRFAAGAMRVAAVLAVLAGATATYAVFNPSQIPGAEALVLPGLLAIVVGVLLVASSVVAALILWGFADGLILLADLDDAQRFVRTELSDLVLLARTARGPFHHEAVGRAAGEPEATQREPVAVKEQALNIAR